MLTEKHSLKRNKCKVLHIFALKLFHSTNLGVWAVCSQTQLPLAVCPLTMVGNVAWFSILLICNIRGLRQVGFPEFSLKWKSVLHVCQLHIILRGILRVFLTLLRFYEAIAPSFIVWASVQNDLHHEAHPCLCLQNAFLQWGAVEKIFKHVGLMQEDASLALLGLPLCRSAREIFCPKGCLRSLPEGCHARFLHELTVAYHPLNFFYIPTVNIYSIGI